MSIKGTCAVCGFVFLLEYGLQCPACHMTARVERVRQTFAPIDPLRTALAVHLNTEGYRWHGGTRVYDVLEDTPEYHIPTTEADQVYQLRRLFRI
jgi:hypothetical protein